MPTKSTPLDPLSRRLLQAAGVLAVLVILVALNSFLHDDGESPFDPNPMAQAAARIRQEPGARMTMNLSVSAATGQSMTMNGTGVFNGLDERSRVAMTMSSPAPPGQIEMEVVTDAENVYVQSSLFSGQLPAGKEWIAADPEALGASGGPVAGGLDASSQLEMLESVADGVVVVGSQQVRGVTTTRYRGAIDLDGYADLYRELGNGEHAEALDQLGELASGTIEAWIDRRGLLRKMAFLFNVGATAGAPTGTMRMEAEFFDFGSDPVVTLPAPVTVLDASSLPGFDTLSES
jgi:hypothetical protein